MNLKKKNKLKIEIDNLTDLLLQTNPESAEYATIASNLDKLVQIQNSMKGKGAGISKETMLKLAAIFVQTCMVLNFEKFDVITTKAWNLVPRVKL